MSRSGHLHLFEGYGIELEYMIVDRATLAARPITDQVLKAVAGEIVGEVELGATCWSNELVLHVVELKTNGPAPALKGLGALFQSDIRRLTEILAPMGARLMPTAMHPFFDPDRETRLWPHDNAEIYAAYNKIFDCRGHGWSNLQSMHINLPFYDDAEFGRLHAAIRLVLPILPALAASSPIYGGKASGLADSRLEFYRHNQRAVPELTGGVIPERAYSEREYDERIFAPIRRAIAPHNPDGILEHEWLNSRGAIGRWDRHAIEIRVLDIQESPRMDAAVAAATVGAVMAQTRELWQPLARQQAWETGPLREIFLACLAKGDEAEISDRAYLECFGLAGKAPVTAGALWGHVVGTLTARGGYPVDDYGGELETILRRGCLSRRILRATGGGADAARVRAVYERLCDVLAAGEIYDDAR